MGVEVGGQFEPRNDGPDHGKLQILTRQLHIDGGVPMRDEHFFQQPEVVGGRAEPVIGQFGEAALREASRNRRGSRAVGIRIGGLGQRREQSPCPGKPRPGSANHGTVAAGYEALVAGDAEFRGHVPEPDMDAAPGVIREKYRQRVLAVREQLEALAAPPRYRGFGVAFQYFSERADLGFIECVARSHARGTRRQKKSGLVEIAEQPHGLHRDEYRAARNAAAFHPVKRLIVVLGVDGQAARIDGGPALRQQFRMVGPDNRRGVEAIGDGVPVHGQIGRSAFDHLHRVGRPGRGDGQAAPPCGAFPLQGIVELAVAHGDVHVPVSQ